jgi:hypothetical protein
MKYLWFFIFLAFLAAPVPALAEGLDLSIEAITSVDPDSSLPLTSGLILMIVLLLVVALVLAAPMPGTSEGLSQGHNAKVKDLFLPIKILSLGQLGSKSASPPKPYQKLLAHYRRKPTLIAEGPTGWTIPLVHLRDLSPKNATLVLATPLQKGQRLDFDLSSLPGFLHAPGPSKPDPGTNKQEPIMVTAEVKSCWPEERDGKTFMAGIKFIGLPDDSKERLELYVNQLCSGAVSGTSPAAHRHSLERGITLPKEPLAPPKGPTLKPKQNPPPTNPPALIS